MAVSYRDFDQIGNSRIRTAVRVSSECPFLEVRIAAEPLCVGMTSGVEVDNRSDGDTQGAEVNGQSGPSLCRVQSGLGRAV